eukprot:TRINITY_DN16113_c0_g1_i1.p1 TRINITY_DN16113_c0_g1~~TRINITY_DN16113_c0_g1_i1.p1  ORF type:complete len:273 (-),score=46.29 TRINITY_DN16113_c0_g1_i1:244-1062(-)
MERAGRAVEEDAFQQLGLDREVCTPSEVDFVLSLVELGSSGLSPAEAEEALETAFLNCDEQHDLEQAAVLTALERLCHVEEWLEIHAQLSGAAADGRQEKAERRTSRSVVFEEPPGANSEQSHTASTSGTHTNTQATGVSARLGIDQAGRQTSPYERSEALPRPLGRQTEFRQPRERAPTQGWFVAGDVNVSSRQRHDAVGQEAATRPPAQPCPQVFLPPGVIALARSRESGPTPAATASSAGPNSSDSGTSSSHAAGSGGGKKMSPSEGGE